MVLFINNQDAYSAIDSDAQAMQMMRQLASNYRQLGMCIIMGQLPNTGLGYGAAPSIKVARDALRFMMFCNLDEQRTIEVSITVSKEFAKPLVANEAYFVEGSHITKLRTVKPSKAGIELIAQE
jgi:S-DNA-T family DNA segregation ATPase FtsK/SpoIIIE